MKYFINIFFLAFIQKLVKNSQTIFDLDFGRILVFVLFLFSLQSDGPAHGVAFKSWSGGGAAVPCNWFWMPKGFR
jgi:hypothetical protein